MEDSAKKEPSVLALVEGVLSSGGQHGADPVAYVKRILVAVADLLVVERVNLYIYDSDLERAWLKCSTDLISLDLPVRRSLVGEALIVGKSVIIPDMTVREGIHREVDRMSGFISRNCLCVPIYGHSSGRSSQRSRAMGVLELLNKRDGSPFSERDRLVSEVLGVRLSGLVGKWYVQQHRRRDRGRSPLHKIARWFRLIF